VDAAGNLYIADTANNRIRKVSTNGIITTVAGVGGFTTFSGDGGPATSATLGFPLGVAVDAAGNLYIADTGNGRIRKVNTAGTISTVAGNGNGSMLGNGGPATSAQLANPHDVAVDSAGNIYVSDTANNAIRKITVGRVVTTLAGLPGTAGNADGNGPDARFWGPQGLSVDSAGNIYVADTGNNAIRKISPMGVVSTVPLSTDKTLSLNSPGGVAVDANGNVYIADTDNHCIRKIAADKGQ
ncbi:MAG: hypothetical protein ACREKE_04705, partial [bacterium]